jgi:hypothetical protein
MSGTDTAIAANAVTAAISRPLMAANRNAVSAIERWDFGVAISICRVCLPVRVMSGGRRPVTMNAWSMNFPLK